MKIYLWCSLTHTSEEYRNNIAKLKERLREDYIVFDFIGLIDWTNEDVYKSDRNCVKTCDVMIAECSEPSTWLWYELWLWVEIWKKIFAFAHKSSKVSRMILWINKDNYKFERYIDFEDFYQKIMINLKMIENKL